MSLTFRRSVGAFLFAGSAALTVGGGAAIAQEVVELPQPSIVLEVAPSVDGDIIGIAPQTRSFALSADGVDGAMFFAQPVGNDPASLLDMGNVQKELELIDDQKERIREAQRKMHEGMQKHFTEMRELHTRRIRDRQDSQPNGGVARGEAGGGQVGGGPVRVPPRIAKEPEEFKKSQERVKELRDQLAKEVDNVLLPHQKKRLDEIALRMKMKQRGTSGSLVDTELAKTLDISDAQKERIRRRAIAVQKELEEKIAKLREEAREEIVSELSPDQQQKLKDLLGTDFNDKPQYAPPPRIRQTRPPVVEPKPEGQPEAKPEERGS